MLVLAMPWIIYMLLANFAELFLFRRANSVSFFFSFFTDSDTKEIASICGWIVLALVTNLVLYRWAKPRLLSRFRTLATQPVRANP
jgi:hypothetical protein